MGWSLPWPTERDKGTLGLGLREGGLTVAWLRPRKGAEPPVLGFCKDLRGTPADCARALKELVEGRRLKGARCVSVMEPGSYQLLQVEPPEVPEEELRAALSWKLRELIAFPIEQAVIDLYWPPEAVRQRVRTLQVVVARDTEVQRRVELVEAAGLKLEALDIRPLVQRNVAAMLPHNEPGLALLSLNDDDGLITLIRQDEIYLARELDFGLDALPPPGTGADDPAFERVTLELQRSLDYYESALSQSPLTRILIYPGGARCEGLLAALKQNFFQLQVHELLFEDVVEVTADEAERFRALPGSLHALGAALRHREAA